MTVSWWSCWDHPGAARPPSSRAWPACSPPRPARSASTAKVVSGLSGAALSEYRRHTVGVVFQAFNLIPSLSARSNVMVPLRLAGVSGKVARERADNLLDQVGLDERGHHRPDQMSGGQQQRVAIARALVQDPPLVLADEPTAHLDYIQVEGILRLLRELAAPGRLVIVATHDERITQLADRVVELVPHLPDSAREPQPVTLTAGQVLFSQGDDSDLVYMVESGEVEIYRTREDGTEEHLTIVEAGQLLRRARAPVQPAPGRLGPCSHRRAAHRIQRPPLPQPPSQLQVVQRLIPVPGRHGRSHAGSTEIPDSDLLLFRGSGPASTPRVKDHATRADNPTVKFDLAHPTQRQVRDGLISGVIAESIAIPILLTVIFVDRDPVKWWYIVGAIACILVSVVYVALFVVITKGRSSLGTQATTGFVIICLALTALAFIELGV